MDLALGCPATRARPRCAHPLSNYRKKKGYKAAMPIFCRRTSHVRPSTHVSSRSRPLASEMCHVRSAQWVVSWVYWHWYISGWHHTRRAPHANENPPAERSGFHRGARIPQPSGGSQPRTRTAVCGQPTGLPPNGRCRDTERTLLYFSRTLLCRDQARARWPASTSKASSHGCSWRPAPGASHSTSQDSRVKLSVSISSAALPANALRVDLEDALLPAAEAPLAVSGQAEQTVDA